MGNGQQPMVGTRIPYAWMDQIQAICQETGKCESEVLREAIAHYLGKTDLHSVASMSRRLAALERKVAKLTQLV